MQVAFIEGLFSFGPESSGAFPKEDPRPAVPSRDSGALEAQGHGALSTGVSVLLVNTGRDNSFKEKSRSFEDIRDSQVGSRAEEPSRCGIFTAVGRHQPMVVHK